MIEIFKTLRTMVVPFINSISMDEKVRKASQANREIGVPGVGQLTLQCVRSQAVDGIPQLSMFPRPVSERR